ncbi:MAG: hypothetical protein ACI906_001548 [Candidatus Latescibacterota bacterium]|jgi:hypothetical protein
MYTLLKYTIALALMALLWAGSSGADELRFDTAAQWRLWHLPGNAVEVTPTGMVRPVAVQRHANAVLDARAFGGGIRGAGSNLFLANNIIDGDESTGWSPDLGNLQRGGWIEVELGRAVSAEWIELVFDEAAPPFELFELLLSNGSMIRDETRSFIEGTLVYPIKERYVQNDRHRVRYTIEEPAQSLVKNVRVQVIQSAAGARLVEVVVQGLGDNLALEAIGRGGEVDIAVEVDDPLAISKGRILAAFDGLITTHWSPTGRQVNAEDTFAHIRVDLGAAYWVDQMRLISNIGGGFGFRFYEVETSDGSLAPDGSLVWHKHFSGNQTNLPPRQGFVDHIFASLPTRFVQVRWKFWDSNCQNGAAQNTGCFAPGNTQEMQVFGAGFPQEVRLRSPLLDLGGDKNVHALRWSALEDAEARVELRSRSGNSLETKTSFYDRDDKEITEKQWNRLIPSFRGGIDTSFVAGSDWSPWSSPYSRSGEGFLSPSPKRYVEVEARLISGDIGRAAAALDWIALDFTAPLAGQVVGEIYPVEVKPGVESEFSYFVKAPQSTTGFDRLALESSTPLRFVGASIDAESVEVDMVEDAWGFSVHFPRRVRQGELVELRFVAEVFLQGTLFDAFLEDSALGDGIRQRVEAGDATEDIESSTNAVRLPLAGGLFANAEFEPHLITPNGDGLNDVLHVHLDLVNLLVQRPLKLEIYDLSGHLVRLVGMEGKAGPQHIAWDGRDRNGTLVAPGTYLARLLVEGDARGQSVEQVVGVAY